MVNEIAPVPVKRSFEGIKRLNQHGAEYWSARDLQPLLGRKANLNTVGMLSPYFRDEVLCEAERVYVVA